LDKRNFPVAGNNDSGKSSYFTVSLAVTFAIRKLLYLPCTVYRIYCMNVELKTTSLRHTGCEDCCQTY
jgi:hypothetical protein